MAVNVPINFIANVDTAATEFKKLTTVFKALGAAFVADKVVDGLRSIVNSAAEAQKSASTMRNALKLAGDFSERNAVQFQKFAEAMQQVTVFDDDLILSQVAVAKQFGATNKQAQELITAAVDLAAATGMELPNATQLLAKSLDGTAGKLNELVPAVRRLTAEQLASGEAIRLVGERFRGAAQEATRTYAGAMAQAKNSVENLKESLGALIVENDLVIKGIAGFKNLVDQINSDKNLQAIIASVVAFSAALLASIVVIKNVGAVIIGLQAATTALGISMSAALGPIGLVVAAVGALAAAGAYAIVSQKQVASTQEILQKQYDETLKSVNNLRAAIERDPKNDYNVILRRNLEAQENKLIEITRQLARQTQIEKQKAAAAKKTADGFDDQLPKLKQINQELLQQFSTLEKGVKNIGATQAETISNNYLEQVALVRRALEQGIADETRARTVLKNLTMQFDQQIAEARKKEQEERLAKEQEFLNRLREIATNPLKIAFGDQINTRGISASLQEGLSAGIGSISTVLGGREGARNLIGGFAEAAGQAFFGVPGLGELAKVLSQGPDKVRELVREFAKALPDLIEAIILAIPVLIEELANAFPVIIERLAERAPDIITKLVEAMPRVAAALISSMPRVAAALVGRLLQGAGQFVGKILEGAAQFISRIVEAIGKEIQKAGENLNPFRGGGFGIGGGNTRVGIDEDGRVRIGPVVLKGGGTNGLAIPRSPSAEPLSDNRPVNAQIVVQIERKELAKAIVDLNRLGYRLA